ncbi:hypothetical protein Pfo_015169 [Paulownia fortunei]|nr:hypothetical protein Pfo_015169 [Paulownia fortunei]
MKPILKCVCKNDAAAVDDGDQVVDVEWELCQGSGRWFIPYLIIGMYGDVGFAYAYGALGEALPRPESEVSGTTMFLILSLSNTRTIISSESGDYFVFPGSGKQFKNGVNRYIDSIEKALINILFLPSLFQTLPVIEWGKKTRVILDVGCVIASFGGSLLDRNIIIMSFAQRSTRVIETQKLTFADNSYDLIHCAQCRVHWDADGSTLFPRFEFYLLDFMWSATPVYRSDERDQKSMVALIEAICWMVVAKTSFDSSQIGLVIYQKPGCLVSLPGDSNKWPSPWKERLMIHLQAYQQNQTLKKPSINAKWCWDKVGLMGIYHGRCESFNTYTYDLLHSSFIFRNLSKRCDIIEVAAEMDRKLILGGYLLLQCTMEIITKLTAVPNPFIGP